MLLRLFVTVLLAGHGVAHLVGFLAAWRLADFAEVPYRTSILDGRLDVGTPGARIVGLAWLVFALAFGGLAIGAALDRAWWSELLPLAVLGSMMLCLVGWPDARFGLVANLLIVAIALGSHIPPR